MNEARRLLDSALRSLRYILLNLFGLPRTPLRIRFWVSLRKERLETTVNADIVRSIMPDPNPVTLVVAELLARLQSPDFEPFVIVTSDGSRHEVPTRDHCVVTKILRRIEVETDDGTIAFINPLHITKFERRAAA